MSDYIPLSIHKFEHLPNELLCEIFDYMQLSDILRCFYNLNNRFNSLLCSSNIHLYILYPDDVEQNNSNQNLLLSYLINQKGISRLRLVKDQNIPRFLNFSHIRSLILDIPTSKLIELITPSRFPRLEYLRIGYTSAHIQLNKLHQGIFSNAFPSLKKCSLNNINDNKQWTGSSSIRSLGIWSNNPRTVVEQILLATINLISLHLFLNWPSNCVILDDQIIPQHFNLKRLKLHLNGFWSLAKFDSLLAYIPIVQILSLYSSYFDSNMIHFQWNFKELAFIFLCRLPKLSYFDCEFIFQNQQMIDLDEIYSLHSSFYRIKQEKYSENQLFTRVFTDQ